MSRIMRAKRVHARLHLKSAFMPALIFSSRARSSPICRARGGHDHAAACEVAAHIDRRADFATARRAPRSVRPAARGAAVWLPAARSKAAAAARPTDRPPADWRVAQGRRARSVASIVVRRNRETATRIWRFSLTVKTGFTASWWPT